MAAIEPRNVGSEDYLIAGTQALELHHLYRAMAFLGQEPCSACARGRANERATLTRIVVWRLDRWGRSLLDLIGSLQELSTLGVGFVSLCEALDLTTPSGRALAGMLAVFAEFEREILRDRVKAGIAQARQQGRSHGRPSTVKAQLLITTSFITTSFRSNCRRRVRVFELEPGLQGRVRITELLRLEGPDPFVTRMTTGIKPTNVSYGRRNGSR